MRILMSSYAFYPSIGGIESVSEVLAAHFVRAGHELKIVTHTADCGTRQFDYEVSRRPSALSLLRVVKWSDIYFQNNVSVEMAWPLLAVRKPWIVTHQTWLTGLNHETIWKTRLKQALVRKAHNVSISEAIRAHLRAPSDVIGNPYDDETFILDNSIAKNRDIIFAGRLVSDKGVDTLLEAVKLLKTNGSRLSVTIIGSGDQLESLKKLAMTLGIDSQIHFAGPKRGRELAQLMNEHRIMVVPSRWKEPFGIVALEGIACGCVVIGSCDGGLTDAIGKCGVTFKNGNSAELAERIGHMLNNPALMEECRRCAPNHLVRFKSSSVANAYLKLFRNILELQN